MPKKKQPKTCRICGAPGVNAKTCPGNPNAKNPLEYKHAPDAKKYYFHEIARKAEPHMGEGKSLEDLPNELLIMILSEESMSDEDLYHYSQVNSRMASIVKTVLMDRFRKTSVVRPVPTSFEELFGKAFIAQQLEAEKLAGKAAMEKLVKKPKPYRSTYKGPKTQGSASNNPNSKGYRPDLDFGIDGDY